MNMNILRRKSHAGENRDNSPISEMKQRNHPNRDDVSAADTAELSAESAERTNNSFFCRKAPIHIGDDVDMTEESGEASSVGSSSMARQRHNKPIHTRNGGENNVELLDLKAPAPMEPNEYTKEEYEDMIQEYEDEIVRLEKLNATLSANVAALYAENAAAEEELCHQGPETSATTRPSLGSKQTSMEMSPDEEYAPLDNDMILAEDQYLHEIAKHQKSNNKLKKQLDTQKKLVSKLSLHLKTSADKITALNKEIDEWKAKPENVINNNAEEAQEDPNEDVHQYQVQVIKNELISLQNLMIANAKAHRRDRQQMLEQYRNEDALWTSKLERPMDTMKRIIRSVTGDYNGGIIDTPIEDHFETKSSSTLEKQESTGNSGFNVLDSVTSLFGRNHCDEQIQSKVEIDEHPLSNEIKTFDVSRLKKTAVVVEESHDKVKQEECILADRIENNVDEYIALGQEEQVAVDDAGMDVAERECHRELRLSVIEAVGSSGDEDTEPMLKDEEHRVDDSAEDDTAIHEDSESVIQLAGKVSTNVTEAAAAFDEENDIQSGSDDECAEKASYVEEIDAAANEDAMQKEENKDEDKDQSSDEESMYDGFEGKYVAREGKGGLEHASDRKTDNKVGEADLTDSVANNTADISTDASQLKSDDSEAALTDSVANNTAEISADASQLKSDDTKVGEGNVILLPKHMPSAEDTPAPTQSIDVEKEDRSSPAELEKTYDQHRDEDKPITSNEDKGTSDDGKQDIKSISHYQDVISQFTLGDSSVSALSKHSKNSKHSFSRKQLFQREGLSCSDLFVDVVDDVFRSPEGRQVLVDSQNGRDPVPPYEPPTLPPERKKDAPHYKRGAKDGYYMYKSSSGNEYSGHWKSGRRHGYGMAKYRDGEVFHGDWRRGRRHGHGVLHLANRDVFDGDWDTNQKHGLGVYHWADGEVDISWYEKDARLESVRWNEDRRLAYLLDMKGSKKEQISLNKAAKIVKGWEKKAEVFDC
ncbi:hypothetical protein QTG54_003402 [Skeletonema marinoi]|uniref:Uncharacterized protein n=1 Tax=Skeletonema marinoi TaxID=267567 RepID=A0AAD8YFQ9_9STRA|nr:hypothetical protein QTG54_003402 [Skeletonema marinoi]